VETNQEGTSEMSGPAITILNYATVQLPFTVAGLVASLQAYINVYLTPEWGVSATISTVDPPPPITGIDTALPGQWLLLISDDSDQADALGYHDLEKTGMPRAYCFAKTTLDAGEDFAVTCSHEVAEMLADIDCDEMKGPIAVGRQTLFYINELCDAVEDTFFQVNGLNMSNFVKREYFNPASGVPAPAHATYDLLGVLKAPLTLTPGGYMSVWSSKTGWKQVFGSKAGRTHFNKYKRDNIYSRHSRRMKKAQAHHGK
jgi:hypothetical protein